MRSVAITGIVIPTSLPFLPLCRHSKKFARMYRLLSKAMAICGRFLHCKKRFSCGTPLLCGSNSSANSCSRSIAVKRQYFWTNIAIVPIITADHNTFMVKEHTLLLLFLCARNGCSRINVECKRKYTLRLLHLINKRSGYLLFLRISIYYFESSFRPSIIHRTADVRDPLDLRGKREFPNHSFILSRIKLRNDLS